MPLRSMAVCQATCITVLLALCAAMTVNAGAARQLMQAPTAQRRNTNRTAGINRIISIVNKLRPITHEESQKAAADLAAAQAAAAAAAMVQVAQMDAKFQAVLDSHNKYRAMHQVGPLAWNNVLAASAAAYAAKCFWGHDPDSHAGENLYARSWKTNPDAALVEAVDGWYEEAALYDYTKPEFSGAVGHFTQVVWKGSNELGCAAQVCNSITNLEDWQGGTIVVCRYNPPGNYYGQFASNVFPPSNSTLFNPGQPSPSPQPGPDGNPVPSPSPVAVEPSPSPPQQTPKPSPSPAPIPDHPPPTGGSGGTFDPFATLPAGWFFSSCLNSANIKYKLCITPTGNVTLTQNRPKKVLWSTNTRIKQAKRRPATMELTEEGNLIVADSKGTILWQTGACTMCVAPAKSTLVLKDDGDLAIYDDADFINDYEVNVGPLVWHTNTVTG